MNCLLTLFALCVFDPAGVYVTGEIYQPDAGRSNEGFYCGHQRRFCRGPIGELRIGMHVDLSREWAMDYGVKHISYIMEDDRGYEGAYLSLTWRPMK